MLRKVKLKVARWEATFRDLSSNKQVTNAMGSSKKRGNDHDDDEDEDEDDDDDEDEEDDDDDDGGRGGVDE